MEIICFAYQMCGLRQHLGPLRLRSFCGQIRLLLSWSPASYWYNFRWMMLPVRLIILVGRAVAQAVSRRLPTEAARVRAQVKSCAICGGQSGTGAGFLRVLRFPLPIPIPPTAPHSSSSIIRGCYNKSVNGRRTKWTQSHPTPRN
jgi:hypothetical protein